MDLIKKNSHFLMRCVTLLLVLLLLAQYQGRTLKWKAISDANAEEVAEIEAYNAEILALEAAAASQEESGQEESAPVYYYANGSYSGTAEGFGGDITVTVTLENDVITDITVDSAEGEDESYLEMGMETIDRILSAQSLQVDTVSGATFSSIGIQNAVADALGKAVNSDD